MYCSILTRIPIYLYIHNIYIYIYLHTHIYIYIMYIYLDVYHYIDIHTNNPCCWLRFPGGAQNRAVLYTGGWGICCGQGAEGYPADI